MTALEIYRNVCFCLILGVGATLIGVMLWYILSTLWTYLMGDPNLDVTTFI